jgi:hypothetical protein
MRAMKFEHAAGGCAVEVSDPDAGNIIDAVGLVTPDAVLAAGYRGS